MSAFAILSFALVGCEAAADGQGTRSGDGEASLELTPGAAIPLDYTATWTSSAPGPTRLEIDDGDEPVLVTDWTDGSDGADVPVLGVWGSHTFTARLVGDDGATRATTTFTTGSGPTELSRMTVTGAATWTGYVVTQIGTSDVQTVVVVAPNGEVVWYWQVSGIYLNRVSLRRDGLGVWVLASPDPDHGIPGWIGSVAWDGTVLVDTEPGGHEGEGCSHDLYEMEDGRVLFIGPDTRSVDGQDYIGDTLFSLDANGAEVALWSFWDDFSPNPLFVAPFSWTHANALRWDDARGSLWVGSRDLSALVELDPDTWRPRSTFGGASPSYASPEGTALPVGQHQFDFLEDRLVIHDNRDQTQGSRLVVYDLDFDAEPPKAIQTFEVDPDPVIYDFIMGDVSWVGPDRLLATWSATGLIQERDLDGAIPWSLRLDLGAVFPYTQYVAHLPGSAPVTDDE